MAISGYAKKPSIPSLINWPSELLAVITPMRETIEIITGRRGAKIAPLSGAVTLDDLAQRVNQLIWLVQEGADGGAPPSELRYARIVSALPASGATNEVVVLDSTKTLYRWNGSAWV